MSYELLKQSLELALVRLKAIEMREVYDRPVTEKNTMTLIEIGEIENTLVETIEEIERVQLAQ